jgi:hypothetical protein
VIASRHSFPIARGSELETKELESSSAVSSWKGGKQDRNTRQQNLATQSVKSINYFKFARLPQRIINVKF